MKFKSILFQLKNIFPYPVSTSTYKKSLSIFLIIPILASKGHTPSHLQTKQPCLSETSQDVSLQKS